ncbi:MAG: hypothetical protein HOP15_10905 [Planctomycetes bacterium]|nr:hypothetical protein [Planctomycetota bacterium]
MKADSLSVLLPRCGLRALLSGLFLALAWLPISAGGVGGSGNNDSNSSGGTVVDAPGDDVGSLPTRADVYGITLVGDPSELLGLGATIRGQGRIEVLVLPRGGMAVTFVGNYRLEVDRAALARSHVKVLFRSGAAFTDGRALLALGDSSSAFLAPRRVPLPVARLAASPRVQGHFISLDVLGPTESRAHVAVDFGAERVTLFQRLR